MAYSRTRELLLPWTQQPPESGLRPNLSHPIGRYCTFLLDAGLSDAAQSLGATSKAVSRPTTRFGSASLAASRAIGNGLTYGGSSRLTSDTYTFIIGVDLVTNTNGDGCGCLLALQDGGASTKQLTITFDGNLAGGSGGSGSLCCYEYQNGVTRVGAYADSQVGTGPAIYVITRSGTSVKIYRDGVDVTTGQSTTGSGIPKGALSLFLHKQGEFVYNNLTSPIYFCGILDGYAASQSEAAGIAANPWQLFEAQRIFVPVLASGGPTYTASLTESVVPSEAHSAAWIGGAAVDESASAADAIAAVATLVAAITESAALADALAAAFIAVVAQAEAVAAADAASTGPVYTAAVSEAAAATSAITAAATLVAAIAEAAAAGDVAVAAATWVVLLTEPGVAADTVAAAMPGTYNVSITELAAALDVVAGALANAIDLSAPPVGHRADLANRVRAALRSRASRLSTRTR